MFLVWNSICDSTLEDIRLSVRRTGMADRTFFILTCLSPAGRSAKMPAVFSFQESFGLLQNEKSMKLSVT
jgi:hypothetical protein